MGLCLNFPSAGNGVMFEAQCCGAMVAKRERISQPSSPNRYIECGLVATHLLKPHYKVYS